MKTQGTDRRAAIMLVEDDDSTAQTIRDVLESDGYEVWHAGGVHDAKALLEQHRPDLVILDLMLPDGDGLVFCADLKSRLDVPIIICSASGRMQDRILSLKLGADDFIGKPFDITELEARVEAVLRRATQPQATPTQTTATMTTSRPQASQQRIGELQIDHTRRHVTMGGKPLQLTPTEYRLLRALASQPNEVLSREELAHQVWGYEDASVGRTIDVHIRRLRAKLEQAGARSPVIVSARGFGYKIVEEPEAQARTAA